MSVTTADALTVGSTYDFILNAKKDGVTWNITGATVTVVFRKPDASQVTRSATVTDGPNGVAAYAGTTTDLDVIGGWRRTWRVVLGAIDLRYIPIPFSVQAAP